MPDKEEEKLEQREIVTETEAQEQPETKPSEVEQPGTSIASQTEPAQKQDKDLDLEEDEELADKPELTSFIDWCYGRVTPENLHKIDKGSADIKDVLFNGDLDSKEKDKKLEFSLEKLVESSEEVNNRRLQTNNFFLSLVTGVLGAVVLAVTTIGTTLTIEAGIRFFMIPVLSVCGLYLSFCWWRLLEHYRRISHSKILLVKRLEATYGVRVFSAQYKLMRNYKYMALTVQERKIPESLKVLFEGLLGLWVLVFFGFVLWKIIPLIYDWLF